MDYEKLLKANELQNQISEHLSLKGSLDQLSEAKYSTIKFLDGATEKKCIYTPMDEIQKYFREAFKAIAKKAERKAIELQKQFDKL